MTESMKYEDREDLFESALLEWFSENKRDFLWRGHTDPYKILIAEVMLQRTRAEQVRPVYQEFITRFPDIDSLASAPMRDIDALIKRLGLFWRAALISKMAKYIFQKHDGSVPDDRNKLLEIPGVGDYIADALLVFAFGKKRTIIDSNVVRLVSRFFGIKKTGEMRRNKRFVEFCQDLSGNLEGERIRNFNWALLDLASAICIPHPRCEVCPIAVSCSFFAKMNSNTDMIQ